MSSSAADLQSRKAVVPTAAATDDQAPASRDPFVRSEAPAPRASRRATATMPSHILDHLEDLIAEAWKRWPVPATPERERRADPPVSLQQRAAELLAAIAADMLSPAKPGDPASAPLREAAQRHAEAQFLEHLDVERMAAELAALREAVLSSWSRAGDGARPDDLRDAARFHAAMDAAWLASVQCYFHHARAEASLFVGTLAHDLRTPLGTIALCAGQLADVPGRGERAAVLVSRSAARIAGIVDRVADYAWGQSAFEMPLRLAPGCLRTHFAKVVDEMRAQLPGRSIDYESSGSFEGLWDEGRCAQLLSNLLSNAVQYGDANRVVTVRLAELAGDPSGLRVALSVHNHGPCIPPDERAALFEPLMRGRRGERQVKSGLGLGLFICPRSHAPTAARWRSSPNPARAPLSSPASENRVVSARPLFVRYRTTAQRYRTYTESMARRHPIEEHPAPDPRENTLLAALDDEHFERWRPHFTPITLPLGHVVYESGVAMDYVCFPITAIVSLLYVLEDGASAELAVVGQEGLVGIAVFMGGGSTPSRAVVQGAGVGVRLPASFVKEEFHRPGVFDLLLRYTQALITQMAQTAVCNRHHHLEQQLCRWLLLSLDRREGNHLAMTQELIANMLGVRREGVTIAATKLQKLGLISYLRGHIVVHDRKGVEALCCECYEVVRREYERLLPQRKDPAALR
jgi:signal transduction histidine kinase/CRP-like cAMP-binding protein